MTEDHGWARPGSGDLPPGWSRDQPPPYQPGMAPGGGGPGRANGPGGTAGPGGTGWGPPPGAPGPGGPGWMPPGTRPPAPKPGIVPLRPLGLGELLDGAFTGIRRNLKATLGLAAILMTISGVVEAIASYPFVDATAGLSSRAGEQLSNAEALRLLGQVGQAGGGLSIGLLISTIAATILTGLLTIVYGRAVLGEFLTMGEAWRQVRPRLWPLLGVTLLSLLIRLAVVAVGIGVPTGIAVAVPNPGTIALAVVVGLVALVIFFVYLPVKLAFAASAVVLERSGVGRALARSFRLTGSVTKVTFWRALLILGLAFVITFVITNVIETPFAVGQLPLSLSDDPSTALKLFGVALSAIGAIVATTITAPFSAGVDVLLYVDLRMRREGLDLQLQTAATNPGEADFASLWQPAHGTTSSAPEGAPYGPGPEYGTGGSGPEYGTGGPAPYGTGGPAQGEPGGQPPYDTGGPAPYGTPGSGPGGTGTPPQDGPGQPPTPGGP